jgi:hypothetical protein
MTLDAGTISILVSGVAAAVVGYIWYLPSVFGTAWMRMANISPEMAERGKKRMPIMAILALLASLLVAYVMSYVSAAWGFYDWMGALKLGFWCWAGFVAPTMLGMVLWEQKPFRYYLIVAGYWFVAMLVIAQIIVFGYGFTSSSYSGSPTDAGGQYAGE